MPARTRTLPRKRPRQARSKVTVDALLEAATRVLEREGWRRATTNRIAEAAGVSVGSLYQYFPAKEALVAAVIERRVARELEVFAAALEALRTAPLADAIRTLVRATLALHARGRRFYEAVLPSVARVERERAVRATVDRAADLLARFLAERGGELATGEPAVAAFVALRSLEAVVHAAVLERPALLDDPRFAAELEAMLARYLVR